MSDVENKNIYNLNKKLYIVVFEDGRKLLTTDIAKLATGKYFYEVEYYKDGILEINEDIDEIDDALFYEVFNINGCSSKDLKKIIINSNRSITIGAYAFSRCNNLESLDINCKNDRFDLVSFKEQCFEKCSGLKDVNISSSDKTMFDKECFSKCDSLEEVNQNANTIIAADFAFYGCKKLRHFDFPNSKFNAFEGVFNSCDSFKKAEFNNINCLSGGTHPQYNGLFTDTEITIKKAKVSDLIEYRKYNHFIIENLIIDDISSYGIKNLNKILSMYPMDTFKKVTIGQYELKPIFFESSMQISSPFDLINYLDADKEIIKLFELLISYYNKRPDLLNDLINSSNRQVIDKNIQFIKSLGILNNDNINLIFLSLPKLFEMDFDVLFNNINLIRQNPTVSDNDIRINYFDDVNLTIDLDDINSIKGYLAEYVSYYSRFPYALNSLFCDSDEDTISERIDRLNYANTMHITGEEKDVFLSRNSIDTIMSVDDESFNRIFGDYKERASLVNSKIPYLRGVKTLVYEKLKGYIYQDKKENILFNEVFGNLLKNDIYNYTRANILDYFNNITRYFNDSSSKELEYKKNLICGRILYTLISKFELDSETDISENYIRNQLFNFKNIRNVGFTSSRLLFSHNLDSVCDPKCIEIMLKIDPYSFDLFRNYSKKKEIPIKEQLIDYMNHPSGIYPNGSLSLRKKANIRLLYEKDNIDSFMFVGYEDVRYYRLAKASGYRFTQEEDDYYEEQIADFNKQIDELIADPQFEQYKEQLKEYRIEEVNNKADIMTVFNEFVNNQVTPSNIDKSNYHDFENRLKAAVKGFIEKESKNGTRLSKILASIDMLYRANNRSILYKETEEIVEKPPLIRDDLGEIEKIGIALLALNKMAHQQTREFIPLDYSSRYRFQTSELMDQNQKYASDVVDALNLIGRYCDIETVYSGLFSNKKNYVLKNNKFYDYIDSGEYEKVLLADLTDVKANEIYSFFVSNYNDLRKLYRGSFSPRIKPKIKEFFRDNKDYINYLFKNTSVDENRLLIDNGNILIISEEEKRKAKRLFAKWVEHYNNERDTNDTNVLIQDDYLKLFRSLKKVRDSIKEKPDVVESLVDYAISQRNMYYLKNNFSTILIQALHEELGNLNDVNSGDLLSKIINLTKEEKLAMYVNNGIIMEIQEDAANPDHDVLVIYSRNVREPYSIHLTKKAVVSDEIKEKVKENQVIVNSLLDNKNLTFYDTEFSFDFKNIEIDLSNSCKVARFGRSTAILLNFINIDLSSLLIRYGINRDVLVRLLNDGISINENNLDQYVDKDVLNRLRETLNDKDISDKINNIINGINKMIKNLEDKRSLSIPEDMELDEEFEYLRGYRFDNINSLKIPNIISMIGKKIIGFQKKYDKNYWEIVNEYKSILNDPNNPKYQETLRKVIIDLSTTHDYYLDENTKSKVYYFGNDEYKFRIGSNKALKTLHSFNKIIDMSLIEDDVNYKKLAEDYISRVVFLRISKAADFVGGYKNSYNEALEIRKELIKDSKFTCDKCNLKVYNISGKFKNHLDEDLYNKILELIPKMYKASNARIEFMPVSVGDDKATTEDDDSKGTRSATSDSLKEMLGISEDEEKPPVMKKKKPEKK